MKILFVVSEVEDLAKTGGLADVAKSLPLALQALGHDVRIVKPYYKEMADKYAQPNLTETQTIHCGGQEYPFNIKRLELQRVPVYCVDYPAYFHRSGLYSDGYQPFADNAQRFAFFSLAALHTAEAVEFQPDIVHCNDWHTALCPYFMKHDKRAFFQNSKSVLTLHNAAFQGIYRFADIPLLREHSQLAAEADGYGELNFLRMGIKSADKINAVSPNYALELLTPLGSHHLYQEFHQRRADVSGVLNGCDYSQWDPSTDPYIDGNYDVSSLAQKRRCKEGFQRELRLPDDEDVPLFGMVCRLTDQKGFGFILPILESFLQHKVQLVIIGTGDPGISEELQRIQHRHPSKMVFKEDFSTRLAHRLEAGCDFFLMPSLFEPCGLNQMYSLAYGTLPIVRRVGGLADTVIDIEEDPRAATGLMFDAPDSSALLHCLRRALLFYYEYPEQLAQVRQQAMHCRFTWQDAAQNYLALYHDAQQA